MAFEFKEEDKKNITKARDEGGKVWENELVADLKHRIKEHFLADLEECCCYCRKNIHSEFKFVLDIEHILPKSKYDDLMFELFNLSVSCKRCNMLIKRDNVSFIVNEVQLRENFENQEMYAFVHPNLDNYYEHLNLVHIQFNQHRIIKYFVVEKSSKGKFAYDFLKLSDLEMDSYDKAQGIKTPQELSEKIDVRTIKAIEDLMDSI